MPRGVGAGELALSRSHLAQQRPKRGSKPKISLGKGGRGIENTDTKVLGKRRSEGLDAGGHKPQPAAASTALHQHRRRSHNARPATSRVGSSPPAAVLSHDTKTQAHGIWALPWHSQAAGHSSLPSAAAAGTPLKTCSRLSQLGFRGKPNFFVPRLHLSQGLVAMVPLPWAKGNIDPSATAQSHKAQLLLLSLDSQATDAWLYMGGSVSGGLASSACADGRC